MVNTLLINYIYVDELMSSSSFALNELFFSLKVTDEFVNSAGPVHKLYLYFFSYLKATHLFSSLTNIQRVEEDHPSGYLTISGCLTICMGI